MPRKRSKSIQKPKQLPKISKQPPKSPPTIAKIALPILSAIIIGLCAFPSILRAVYGLDHEYLDTAERFGRLGLVSLLWGATNPWIEDGARAETLKSDASVAEEALSSVGNKKFALAFAANKAGSVLNSVLLNSYSVHIVNTTVNALTVVFTAIVSSAYGIGVQPSFRVAIGICFILLGVAICNLATPIN